jgi:hypothetical protein
MAEILRSLDHSNRISVVLQQADADTITDKSEMSRILMLCLITNRVVSFPSSRRGCYESMAREE